MILSLLQKLSLRPERHTLMTNCFCVFKQKCLTIQKLVKDILSLTDNKAGRKFISIFSPPWEVLQEKSPIIWMCTHFIQIVTFYWAAGVK